MRHIRASEGSGAALAATAVEFEPTASKTQDWLLPAAPSIPFVGWGSVALSPEALRGDGNVSKTLLPVTSKGKGVRAWEKG